MGNKDEVVRKKTGGQKGGLLNTPVINYRLLQNGIKGWRQGKVKKKRSLLPSSSFFLIKLLSCSREQVRPIIKGAPSNGDRMGFEQTALSAS
jgi:hypothetical protein